MGDKPTSASIYQGRILNISKERATMPDGRLIDFELVRHPGGAVIVALDDEQRVCMIRQFRYALDTWIWELPAGILDPGEAPETTAPRELKEETGVSAKSWMGLGLMHPSPGFCNECLYLFLAQDLSVGKPAREEKEFIEVHWLGLDDAIARIATGEISDAKTIIGLFRAREALVAA